MLYPDAPQAIWTTTASGEQRATAWRLFGASLCDGDRSHVGQGNRMRKTELTVPEAVTFDAEAVTVLAKVRIAADVLAVDLEPDMNTGVGVVSLVVMPPFFQSKTSLRSPMPKIFDTSFSAAHCSRPIGDKLPVCR